MANCVALAASPTDSIAEESSGSRARKGARRKIAPSNHAYWPQELDQCLRAALAQGRPNVRIAVNRMLQAHPALTRAQCWQRLRWLREHTSCERPTPDSWPVELIEQLRAGYRCGGACKRDAFRAIRTHFPNLPGHVIVRFARSQGWLTTCSSTCVPRRRWTAAEQAHFASMAEHRSVTQIAQALGRSTKAVRWRLGAQGLSARIEGVWSLRQLGDTFHIGTATLRRRIVEHALRVRDAHITGASLLACRRFAALGEALRVQNRAPSLSIQPDRHYRWKEAAQLLGHRIDFVQQGVAHGVLKLVDARVSDAALQRFCTHYAQGRLHCDRIEPAIYRWLVREYGLPVE